MRLFLVVTMCIGLLNAAGFPVRAETGGGRREHPVARKADAAILAQIDAAIQLAFESGKEKALLDIASRPFLSAPAQHYLVIKGTPSLAFESSRLNVMLALVNNPYLLAEGRQAVVENLTLLAFEGSKKNVLAAINKRGQIPSEREAVMQRRSPERLPDLATLAQIDAVTKLTFDSDKEKTLSEIASQPYLSAQAQTHLVTAGVRSLTFESSRLSVLLALINNPHFLAEGKQAVVENLNLLTFENSKRQVLAAINQRGQIPSERQAMTQRRPLERLPDLATLAQIDAAIKLTFDSHRGKTLAEIASQPYLSAQAQTHLVKVGVRSLTFESSRLSVLLALVNNPHFLAEGKQAIVENLNLLTFENSKRQVLAAINQRGHIPAERDFLREHHFPLQQNNVVYIP